MSTTLPRPGDSTRTGTRTGGVVVAVAVLLGAWAPGALAQGQPGQASAPPHVVIQKTIETLVGAITALLPVSSKEPPELNAVVAQVVLPRVDLERMSSQVLGRHWRRANPTQRGAFIEAFRPELVRMLSRATSRFVEDLLGETVSEAEVAERVASALTYLPPKVESTGAVVTVPVRVQLPQGSPVVISYRMRRSAERWKICDMMVGSISLSQALRNSFAPTLRTHGIDGLIARIGEKNRELATRGQHEPGPA